MTAKTPGDTGVEERADELVERVTHDVRHFAERVVGRVREEAEDVWAEARSTRDAPPPTPRPRR
jgi:DNA-directed RNA polymerase specialized sigma24 family protein